MNHLKPFHTRILHSSLLLTMISWTYPNSSDPKITPKGPLTYRMRYMVRTLPNNFIDVVGDETLSANKEIWD